MDRQSCDQIDKWLDRGIFRKQRHDINGSYIPFGSKFPYDYTLLMRDKEAFEMLMRFIFGSEKRYLQSKAIFKNSKFYKINENGRKVEINCGDLIEEFDGKKIVWKNTFGFGGSDIKVCEIINHKIVYQSNTYEIKDFLDIIDERKSIWLIQEFINQHEILNIFNNSSVNTMRILTYNTGERVVFGNAVLRFGKEGSCVDNCDRGGYYCGISDSGTVGDDMFSFTEKMRYKCPHASIIIPFFKEALELVIETHNHIPQLFSVGWDIVITSDGPMILEGNDGWDPYLSQTPLGYAQRNLWNILSAERNSIIGNN